MKISVVTPCLNSARFLDKALRSVTAQRAVGVDLEYIVVDGGSRDGSLELIERHRAGIDRLMVGPDRGPADAINKGFDAATGDLLAWLNADDLYAMGALRRVCDAFERHPEAVLCYGHCQILDAHGNEVRRAITRLKAACFPFSCRALLQTLNYVSQPAVCFRASAFRAVGGLRMDLRAAWDYDLWLRLWRQGRMVRIPRPALAGFRWTPDSISGRHYREQFREELSLAVRDAGRFSVQAAVHALGCRVIVGSYALMNRRHEQRTGAQTGVRGH